MDLGPVLYLKPLNIWRREDTYEHSGGSAVRAAGIGAGKHTGGRLRVPRGRIGLWEGVLEGQIPVLAARSRVATKELDVLIYGPYWRTWCTHNCSHRY